MPVVNALLVRWLGGYQEETNPTSITAYGRREGLLSLGPVTTTEEVERIAQGLLMLTAEPRVATELGIEPTGVGDLPYDDYDIGDTISAPDETGTLALQRVVSITVTEDQDGEVSYANELKDTVQVTEEQQNRWLKLLLAGSLRGNARNAMPILPPSTTNG